MEINTYSCDYTLNGKPYATEITSTTKDYATEKLIRRIIAKYGDDIDIQIINVSCNEYS